MPAAHREAGNGAVVFRREDAEAFLDERNDVFDQALGIRAGVGLRRAAASTARRAAALRRLRA